MVLPCLFPFIPMIFHGRDLTGVIFQNCQAGKCCWSLRMLPQAKNHVSSWCMDSACSSLKQRLGFWSILVHLLSGLSCQPFSWSAVVVEMRTYLMGRWDTLSKIYGLSVVLRKYVVASTVMGKPLFQLTSVCDSLLFLM